MSFANARCGCNLGTIENFEGHSVREVFK